MQSSKRRVNRIVNRSVTRSVASIFELEQLEIRRFLNSASVNSSHVLVINGTTGNDTITVNQLSNGKVSVSGVSTQFSPGTSSGKFNQISVNAGNGNDLVQINNNVTYTSSTISGSNGNDTLTGGKGNDSIDGDNDNDTLDGGGGGADLLRGDSGEDLANYSYRTDNLNISLDGVANDGASGEKDNVQTEEVFTGSGNDTLTGSSGDDMLDGGAGNDNIQGEAGDDIVTGSTGSDTLEGQTGSDYLQAKNNDLDEVSGGTDSGGTDHDLASVDPQDIPVPGLTSTVKQAAKLAIKPAAGTVGGSTQPDVDPTYGTNGLAYGPNPGWDTITGAAVDSQGRVIFVGTKNVGTHSDDSEETDMAVARYNASGGLDTTFGSDGELDIDFTAFTGAGYHDDSQGNSVTIGPDDSIYAVGSVIHSSEFRTDSDFALAKIDSSGQLDSTFGSEGTFSADLPQNTAGDSDDVGNAAAVDSNGNVYIVGDRQFAGEEPSYDVVDGFDTANNPSQNGPWSYGYSDSLTSGVNLYDVTTNNSDGPTVWTSSALANSSTTAPDVVYDPDDGDATVDLDPGFYGEYSQAVFTAPTSGEYEVVGEFDDASDGDTTSDVHVLVNGQSQFDGIVEDSSQSFDQFVDLNAGDTVGFAVGFGSNQDFSDDTTQLTATVNQISSSNDTTIAVAKVLADGSGLDTTYGNGAGFNQTNFSGDSDQTGFNIALTNGDSPQAVIGGEEEGNFLVAKYTADGSSLDDSFNNGAGWTNSDGNNDSGQINAIAIDGNNNIYAVGEIDSVDPLIKKASSLKPAVTPLDNSQAVAIEYDSNGNVVNRAIDSSHTAATYNAVSIDSQGRIVVAGAANDDGSTGLDYLLTRYDPSLNADPNFNGVETDFAEPTSGDDVAYGVRELSNGEIVAGGFSSPGADTNTFSAARYIVPVPTPPPGQIPDIEGYVSDTDLQNPPPGSELAGFLDRLSPTALEIIQGEPSDNGYATVNTGDGNDTVLITTVPGSANKDIVGVNVNGVETYYDDTTTHHFYLNTNGGNDTVIGQDAVDNFNLYVNGGSGNDSIRAVGDESIIQGGTGNDYLAAGNDNAALVGGSGNDTLVGNSHFDLLIGGTGSDNESGGGGEDIMIGGTTAYDTDQVALRAILDEWRSSRSRSQRISDLLNGGGINGSDVLRGVGLSNQTVFDDQAIDTLDGGSSTDWFFRHTGSHADILKNSTGDRIDTV